MSKLDHALALAARGFAVFPIKPGAKSPPLLNGWPQKATSDPDEIRSFWLAVPDANIGVHCKGMVVLDVDPKKGGDDALAALDAIYGIPDTLVARTPSGGRHLYFRGGPVANGVDVLGRGLDVRSAGGYVVAPGSTTQDGSYTWEDESRSVAEAPEWLVLKLGTVVPKTATTASAVPDASAEVVERARQWLVGQLPAFEGQGGDARTFAVACGLRDQGVSQAQALELMLLWNATCVPPWDEDTLAVKIANAYRYAENPAGAKAALPSDFPVIQNVGTSAQVPTVRTKALSLSQFANQEHRGAGYVVKGLLQRRSYASVYGAPGEGKTFVMLDLAYSVAAGRPWMDHKVHAGPVLYLAFEGTGGLVKRAQALRQKYGQADVPLFIAGASMNLRERAGREELGSLMAELPDKPVLVVVDTFARALCGGDENSAQDVGAFNAAIAALIESTGACVTIVHHSGKDKSKGARGSSALLGALDTEIEVDENKVSAKKQRDVEAGAPIGFNLVPLVVGVDADGDEMTSCVVEPAAVSVPGLARLKGHAAHAFDVLVEKWPTNKPVHVLDWKEKCRGILPDARFSGSFHEAKKKLRQAGYIEISEDDMVTRRME